MTRLSNQPFFLPSTNETRHVCLFLHGLGGGVYEMQPLAEYLATQGYATCGILYPGHDQPANKMPPSRWQDWYTHVEATYVQLQQQYEKISLVGFSTGCLLALELALSQGSDRIQSLILMAPYFRIKRYPFQPIAAETLVNSIGYLVPDLPRFTLPIKDPQMLKAAKEAAFFQTFNLEAVRSANELIQVVKPRVSRLKIPTLIFQSRADSVVNPPEAQWLYEQLQSPQKSLEWLTKSDHIIPLDVERDQVFQKTSDFLGSLKTSR